MVSVPPLLVTDRVLFDSRALFSAPPTTESEIEAQRRKPQPPLRRTVTGRHPLLRLIGRDNLDLVQPWIEDWAPIVAGWLRAGLSPSVFTPSIPYEVWREEVESRLTKMVELAAHAFLIRFNTLAWRCRVKSCSHRRSTRQPFRRSSRVTRWSRDLFAVSFFRQKAALDFGCVP